MGRSYYKAPKSLTYFWLMRGTGFSAYDSQTSSLIASAETLEELESKCQFLGYTKQKETK